MTGNKPAPDRVALAFERIKAGQLPAAEKILRNALAAQARDPRAWSLLARVLHLSGRNAEARDAVDSALRLDPNFVPAVIEDAEIARVSGDQQRRRAALTRLVELQPVNARIQYDLGAMHLERGDAEAARPLLERALALAPSLEKARFKLANLDFGAGKHAEALDGYTRCLQARDDWTEARLNRAKTLVELKRPVEAAAEYNRVLQGDRDSEIALSGYASALLRAGKQGDFSEMIWARKRLVELNPQSAEAEYRLGNAYRAGDKYREAAVHYARAVELDPGHLTARWAGFQYPVSIVARDDAELADYRRQWLDGLAFFEGIGWDTPEQLQFAGPSLSNATNFFLHYLGEPFKDEQRRYANVVQRAAHRLMPDQVAMAPPAPASRIRIGFLSAYFRRHTVMKLFGSLVTGLDRSRHEISLFHIDDRGDAYSDFLRGSVDHYEIGERDAGQWVRLLRSRELDVLVFLDIGMHPNAQVLAAFRFAQLQCALWGHPVTTGFDTIDWFLTADGMEIDGGERHYNERVFRLPHIGTCFAPPDAVPDDAFAIPARADPGNVHYFVAQSAFKLTPAHDDALARIAAGLPQARFSLLPYPQAHVRDDLRLRMRGAFERRGLDFERHVHFFPFLGEEAFLAVARATDVNLDSIGWSGGNTTLEITWFDTPTITLPGPLMRSRHTYAMLERMELGELVARDLDHYVQLAIGLGQDPARRERLRATIRERKHRLYDQRDVVEAFERFLREQIEGPRPEG
jgi:predicted O-linked N-acetylglucosamine transferase (SPINDLY family)